MKYHKRPLSLTEQVERLQQRQLIIQDTAKAEHYLAHIGYYRLSAYWLPFEQPTQSGETSRNHQFKPNTRFEDVIQLYVFDRKLRLLVMEAIERIEVSVRAQWVNV